MGRRLADHIFPTPRHRLSFYRAQVEEALQQAMRTEDPVARANLLSVAANWTRLAREAEHQINGEIKTSHNDLRPADKDQ
jgi:hypothetical protein